MNRREMFQRLGAVAGGLAIAKKASADRHAVDHVYGPHDVLARGLRLTLGSSGRSEIEFGIIRSAPRIGDRVRVDLPPRILFDGEVVETIESANAYGMGYAVQIRAITGGLRGQLG